MANTRETMGEQACLDALVADTLEIFEDDGVICVSNLAYHNSLQQVVLPNATKLDSNSMSNCSNLESVNAPNVTTLEGSVFQSDRRLASVSFSNVSSIEESCFSGCYSLSNINIGRPTYIGDRAFQNCHCLNKDSIDFSAVTRIGNQAFTTCGIGELVLPVCTRFGTIGSNNSRLSVVDINSVSSIGNLVLQNLLALCHLILRKTNGITTLEDVSSFSSTGIASGVGWIYVPTDLVDSYKAASNWSNYASQIVSISEYPKALQDETISDSWATIAASSTYATDYPIGSIKYVNIGGTRLAMQLVATDTDDLSSGGKARMTWISRDTFTNIVFGLESNVSSVNWDTSWLRNFLRTTIYPQIEQDVRTEIKEVSKTFLARGNVVDATDDKIWIPSAREVGMSTSAESSGCTYASFFIDAASRIKKQGIGGNNSTWWLRSASATGSYNFQNVGAGGNGSNSSPTSTSNVVIGFCI